MLSSSNVPPSWFIVFPYHTVVVHLYWPGFSNAIQVRATERRSPIHWSMSIFNAKMNKNTKSTEKRSITFNTGWVYFGISIILLRNTNRRRVFFCRLSSISSPMSSTIICCPSVCSVNTIPPTSLNLRIRSPIDYHRSSPTIQSEFHSHSKKIMPSFRPSVFEVRTIEESIRLYSHSSSLQQIER